MNLREALLTMSPSLVLQRAASDEIARLDALIAQMVKALDGIDKTACCVDWGGMNASRKLYAVARDSRAAITLAISPAP